MNPEWATRLYPCFSCLIDVEKMSFEELCYKYPKVAIEKMSDDYKTHCEKAPKMGKCLNFCDASTGLTRFWVFSR